ncbi:hypothetical protein ACPF38_003697 [Vibrio cholerae]
MKNIPPVQIPPPRNWQDFENLCCDLWAQVWNDQNTQKNGRSGQAQHGVDIFGRPSNANGKYYGIQCKGKDNYSGSILAVDELNSEVEKASKFSPKIDCFIIATTSVKDAAIEMRAREITEENRKKGIFSVHVFGWPDIVDKLSEHPEIMGKYYSWAIKSNDPNEKLFESWYRDADIKNLQINANTIPFQLFDIRFTGRFLNTIHSYLMKIETNLRVFPSSSANQTLKGAIVNFNHIATDVLNSCYEFENKYDIESDIYTYWVDTGELPYHEQGQFIEFKKGVLKVLFYNLVKAANYVIQIRNSLIFDSGRMSGFIGFIDSFNYNFPILGEPHPSPEYYPLYSAQELEDVGLYQGIDNIKQFVHAQIYCG